MNLTAYFERSYLPRLTAKGVKAQTIADYESVVKSAPQEPTSESVVRWLADKKSASAATRNRHRRYLLAVLRDARKRGLLGDWIEDVPKAYEDEILPRAWTVAEFSRLLAACDSLDESYVGIRAPHWWRSFLLSLWYTGLRVNSLLPALCENLDLGAGTLVITSTKDRKQILYVLPDDACQAIRLIIGQRRHIWPWPFSDRKKTMLRRIRVLIAAAELPQLSKPFHAIRKSVASYVTLQAGVSSACDFLDHCRTEITRKWYVDPRIAVTARRGGQSMPKPA
jgi:integrase